MFQWNYAKQVVKNAKRLAEKLMEYGFDLVSGGTDNHLMLIDLRNKNISGKKAEQVLGHADITANKNMVPYDDKSAFVTSGIRFGSAAATTRGFKTNEFKMVGNFIADVLDKFDNNTSSLEQEKIISEKVRNLCDKFPIY